MLKYSTEDGRVHIHDINGWKFASRSEVPGCQVDKIDAVSILAITQSEKLVVIEQFRVPAGEKILELPAGLVDPGETIVEAAVREFKEETGMSLLPVSAHNVTYPCAGIVDESTVYVIGFASGKPTNKYNVHDEDIKVHLFDLNNTDELLHKLGAGAMTSPLAMFLTGLTYRKILDV